MTETRTMLESVPFVYAKVATLRDGEEGQALLEYALILGLVALVCVTALQLVGAGVVDLLSPVVTAF